jgi:hypothetical protein
MRHVANALVALGAVLLILSFITLFNPSGDPGTTPVVGAVFLVGGLVLLQLQGSGRPPGS